MGLFGGLLSIASKVVSVIASVASTVGKAVSTAATYLAETAIDILDKIEGVITAVGKILDIIKSDVTAEDLGDRAMKSEKGKDDFDSTLEYIDYLQEEVACTDKEELDKLDPEERLARKAIGSALLSKGIEEKTTLMIPMEFWKLSIMKNINAKEINEFLTKFKENGIEPKDFVQYLTRDLDRQEEEKIDSAIIDSYKNIDPDLTDIEIEEKLIGMQKD